ncbi:adenylosuccinate lyase family protein [Ponticoccus sp. SC2-23]|uniref:lyase family protein n=1 Tax=Alexandriicola marinus TaxID=2081710 RepID=UPI000FDBE8EC|nr:lyase family protein [Alexandriicola marinus]MBM1222196.1 adenylosuccinate lyase family protein [Ponticoccus sp. SC6-9]MBM1226883.1 adenylosuccinate lyase family protein [Ponticoccus sp. SC6-15]MBM1231143.1 adenylosuccinate lyase family protein [Ponticoccus sp. SC6-38]MBM1235605.1 adenylosuccinate lyase family protein [Ponticoccus sp. SC6-45]MBM1240165.1 adenylosuccinate lyase family protein [Ponticoccus sp. SC6-49]MBM1244519.1 adenylosuccinate lyase family protein [Ponticoccus sp. SC2-64]
MAASIYDSAMFRDLVQDRETAALFSDTAELRAMLLVWGALAKAQAGVGLIPSDAADAIQRAALEIQIDPAALAAETGRNAVVVPGLASAFRNEMKAPEHAQHLHYGATSQDIADTALALRLRQVLVLAETRLAGLIGILGRMAADHAETPMLARTYGQAAVVTSFGAIAASWGAPLIDALEELPRIRDRVLRVSLSGAAGTLSAMGPEGPAVRAAFAQGLGLSDPGHSWHSDRTGLAALSAWATRLTGSLGKMGADLCLLTRTDLGEVMLGSGGGSSTMPQKSNPVGPSVLVAIASHVAGLNGVMQSSIVHREQRDGGAWIAEWMSLPQICLGLGRALALASEEADGLAPMPDRMRASIDATRGAVFAEALTFRLARSLPRPDAQTLVKGLCARLTDEDTTLPALAGREIVGHDLDGVFDPAAQMGSAPDEARAFAEAALQLAK